MRIRVSALTIATAAAAVSASAFSTGPAFVSSSRKHSLTTGPTTTPTTRIIPSTSTSKTVTTPRSSTSLSVSTTTTDIETLETANSDDDDVNNNNNSAMPKLSDDGVIYEINNKEEHAALLAASQDKLVILKVFAPWCRACKGLEPKFNAITRDPKFNEDNMPIVWATLSIQHNKDFVKSLGVLALPTVQFYVGGKLADTFPCGPSKVPILRRKLAALINDHVDLETRALKESSITEMADRAEQAALRIKEEAQARAAKAKAALADYQQQQQQQAKAKAKEADDDDDSTTKEPTMTEEDRKVLNSIPYFKEMSMADRDELYEKAKLLTFEPGHIIVRQGRIGHSFYVIQSGQVEICQQSYSTDPMVSGGYLGTVINRLSDGDYFGERSLITGEPRAASLRATETVKVWAFDATDFPYSSVLSGRSKGITKDLEEVNDKYGVDVTAQSLEAITKQLRESSISSQIRGSVNTPQKIKCVDDDESCDVDAGYEIEEGEKEDDEWGPLSSEQKEETSSQPSAVDALMASVTDDDAIFALLNRFQMIQHVKQCFEYISTSQATWGEAGLRKRRNLLIRRLSPAQASEFATSFKMIDANQDGYIELLELKRVLDTVETGESDEDFLLRIMSSGTRVNGDAPILTFEDYMGLMAEAEFYHLFTSIFASLDKDNTGFVKAHELDRVLCGVRDLISDDRKSVIDVEDMDMSIDYEQFARMLLGTTLV